MPQSYRSRYLSVLKRNEQGMAALFADLSRTLSAAIARRADADGNVPRTATFELQRIAGDLVTQMFLRPNSRGELAPFTILANGRVLPLSPYMQVLWGAIRTVVRLPVEQNSAMLRRSLPPDVLATMSKANTNPFTVADAMVSELEAADLVRTNPLARYDAPHEWVDANGYQLSDRIWNTAATTRRRLDLYLDTAIREGRGALQMSRELEHFLRPDRSDLRTNAPYGTNASYDAMRLARTEIARAHQEATRVSAAMNPFVEGMKWNLSASHPRTDICDDLAAGGRNGDGVYSIGEYPERPHPNCLCYATQVTAEGTESILDALAADIRRTRAEFVDLVGPVEVERFEQLLLGENVAGLTQARPAPQTVTPAIGRIDNLVSAQDEVAQALINLASDTIDRVHQVPIDLPPVPVSVGALDSDNMLGVYVTDWTSVRPSRLRVNETLMRKELTFLHEFGHYLDHQHLAISDDLGTIALNNNIRQIDGIPANWRDRFWRIVEETDLIKEMTQRRDTLASQRPLLADGGEKTPDERFLDYQLQQSEIWARAYAQWVSTRTERNLTDLRTWSGHWEDNDFAPVGAVIDDIFRAIGLLR